MEIGWINWKNWKWNLVHNFLDACLEKRGNGSRVNGERGKVEWEFWKELKRNADVALSFSFFFKLYECISLYTAHSFPCHSFASIPIAIVAIIDSEWLEQEPFVLFNRSGFRNRESLCVILIFLFLGPLEYNLLELVVVRTVTFKYNFSHLNIENIIFQLRDHKNTLVVFMLEKYCLGYILALLNWMSLNGPE